ncbi:MAG: GPR endopeptidase [Eubacterium sp.]
MKGVNIYTDLALEERERFKRNVEIEGVKIEKKYSDNLDMTTTVVEIFNEEGSNAMGKPEGSYITMETRLLKNAEESTRKTIAGHLSNHLSQMVKDINVKNVLIVGLGNSQATPDALGPKTAEGILTGNNIYCVSPGVLAQTGMETYSIIKGIVREINPDLIIAIDSLAARNVRRVTTTIQLTDTGITPGSGIGNHRKGLNQETLEKRVIAIGVPMVVSGATIVNDTMEKLLNILSSVEKSNYMSNIFSRYSQQEKYQLFEELLSEDTEQMFVTPKDVDEIVDNLSRIIAHALNKFCCEMINNK